MASRLNLPVLDGDIVGYRASPEVFLETITLKGLKRTPLVIANNKGDVGCLENSNDCIFIEKFLRKFAADSGGIAYVCGYPLKVKDIKGIIGDCSLSFCLKLGKFMKEEKY